MLHAMEQEITIPADGRLPDSFKAAFGHKARVIVLLQEPIIMDQNDSERLMAFAGTIDWPIDDPVEWQRQQRNEWERPWD
ncbi:MAG: hypothetical protein HQL94_07070 [Magnetococcales bacterium]|nr:hypothetical protein [Magnetococcales bacterium]MBF0439111.1 hypothetical protein [Magnetococcales bacterium]